MRPVHPAVVHYPIALVPVSVVADLLARVTGSASLRATGWWALLGAAVGAALTLVAGLADMSRVEIEDAAHERIHTHMKVGFVLFTLIAGLTVWRWLIYDEPRSGPGWGYLAAAAVVLALTIFQGWLGGELIYSDGVGVAATGQKTEAAGAGKKSAARAEGRDAEGHGEH